MKTFTPPPIIQGQKHLLRSTIDIPLVHNLYEAYILWHKFLLKFPKSERYTLGVTCDQYLLTIIELVLSAASTQDRVEKNRFIKNASIKIDALKLLIRLCKDCACLSTQQYQQIEKRLYETGKMIGGWLKSVS